MRRLALLPMLALPAFGSAVLSISSCSTDATGTVWTCAVSGGGAGSLTPTSGITNFVPHLTLSSVGSQIAASSVTASGTGASGTVVVTTAMPVQSGETATLDWTTGGNLTDGTNTAQGQSGVAVTNNSTVTGVTLSNSSSNVYWLGRWINMTCSSYANRNCQEAKGYYTTLEFQFTAAGSTDISGDQPDSSSFYVSVDGGAEIGPVSTPTSTTQKWTWEHYTTVAAGAHDVKIYIHTSPTYLLSASAVRLGSASGATCCTDIGAYDGTTYVLNSTPWTTYAKNEAGYACTDAQQNYTGCLFANGTAFALWSTRWYGSGWSSIQAWVYGASGTFKVYMDGVYQGSYTASGSKWSAATLASGLDTGLHLWEVVAAGNGYLYSINGPSGATLVSSVVPSRPFIAAYGDSVTAGIDLSLYPSDHSGIDYFTFPTINASILGAGTSSQTVSVCANGCLGTSYYLRDHTSQIDGIAKPTIALANGGVNDEIYACTATCTANPPAQFNTDYTTMLTNMAGNMQAGGIIIARGILPNSSNNSSTITTWRAAQQAAVAAYNASPTNGVQAFFVDPTGWVNTTTDLVGGLHPNDTGYAKMKLQMIPIEQAAITIRSTAWF